MTGRSMRTLVAVCLVLVGATACRAISTQPRRSPPPMPSASPLDYPPIEAVSGACAKIASTLSAVLGAAAVKPPYDIQSAPGLTPRSAPTAKCEMRVAFCQAMPPLIYPLTDELDFHILDPQLPGVSPLPTASLVPAITPSEVDGLPVWQVGPQQRPHGGPELWILVHNVKVGIWIIAYPTLAQNGAEPSKQSLAACQATWDKLWPKLADTIFTTLR